MRSLADLLTLSIALHRLEPRYPGLLEAVRAELLAIETACEERAASLQADADRWISDPKVAS